MVYWTEQKVGLLDINTIIFHFGPMDNIVILYFSLPEVAIRHLCHDITHVALHFSHYDSISVKAKKRGSRSANLYYISATREISSILVLSNHLFVEIHFLLARKSENILWTDWGPAPEL